MHSVYDTLAGGFPHSDIYRSQLGYQLPVAFRRFQRLSSPLDAKSSAVCPSWFDHSDRTPILAFTTINTNQNFLMTALPCRDEDDQPTNLGLVKGDPRNGGHQFRRSNEILVCCHIQS